MRSAPTDPRAGEILGFWFGDVAQATPTLEQLKARTRLWFAKSDETDRAIRERFGADVERAARGELDHWAETPLGRLALVVLLDQFPRNMFRGSARAFEADGKALALVEEGLAAGVDRELFPGERFVFYLPLMHSEDRVRQARSSQLYARLRDEGPAHLREELGSAAWFADRHKYIVDRFGRFPHRNAALGRASTPEEVEFLKEPNSSF
jgi:uncharacterized protein (DUF924 family)